jgi:hypothetical protein
MIWKLVVMANMMTVELPEEEWGGRALYMAHVNMAEFKVAADCIVAANQVRLSANKDGRVIAFCIAMDD